MSAKLRVIWVDDMRNPNIELVPWIPAQWKKYAPTEFLNTVKQSGAEPEVIWLKSWDEWCKWCDEVWMKEKPSDYINCFCLDHDLGCYEPDGTERTGYNVAVNICDVIEDCGFDFPFYECHSSNPYGRDNILSVFETYKKSMGV